MGGRPNVRTHILSWSLALYRGQAAITVLLPAGSDFLMSPSCSAATILTSKTQPFKSNLVCV